LLNGLIAINFRTVGNPEAGPKSAGGCSTGDFDEVTAIYVQVALLRYTTHVILPTLQVGTLEMPTPYLRAEFNRFWTYDAKSDNPERSD
jgi:hypothetical protein